MAEKDRSDAKSPLTVTKPRYLGLALAVGVVLFVLLLIAITSFQLRNTVTVSGHLVPTSGLSKVYTRSAGQVIRVAAHAGEKVQKGQLLYLLQTSQSSNISRNVQASIRTSLVQKKALLKQKLTLLQDRKALKKRLFSHKINSLKSKVALLQHKRNILATENKKLKSLYKKQKKLADKHLLTAVQLASAMLNYNSSLMSKLEANAKLNTLKNKLQTKKTSKKIELSALKSKILNVKSALTDVYREVDKIAASGTESIYSPINGTIGYLPLHYGQSTTAGELVATIVPNRSELVAKVYLPSSAMGTIQVGDKVKIRYASFPYMKYGIFEGVVSYIALTPSQEQFGGRQSRKGGYATTIRLLDHQNLQLLPGAKLKATIVSSHASFIRMILGPVIGFSKSIVGS